MRFEVGSKLLVFVRGKAHGLADSHLQKPVSVQCSIVDRSLFRLLHIRVAFWLVEW
jgi:hypothetical protein